MDNEKRFLKFAFLKKKNRRISILAGETKDGLLAFEINTKRLIDRKTRHIQSTSVLYGVETMTIIKEVIGMLYDDPEFMMKANKEMGQIAKDKMKCETNILH